jgi:hypothetical protein
LSEADLAAIRSINAELEAKDAELARQMSDIPPDAMGEGGAMFEDDVRAPIMPRAEVLVEDDPYLRHHNLRRARPPRGFEAGTSPNVFEMFRDLNRESRVLTGNSEDPHSKKMRTLADLFKPPFDLLVQGEFEQVKNIAQQRNRWLLVNIQETSIFDCQKMNRDTWSDPGVKAVVTANFILWQVLKTNEEGARYCRFYPVEIMPHLAIIDSRTGERLEVWEGFVEPVQLIAFLEKFLETHSLTDTKPVRPKPPSPTKKLGDLSEEAQLAAAIAASLPEGELIPTPAHAPAPTQTHTPTTTTTTTTTNTAAEAHPPQQPEAVPTPIEPTKAPEPEKPRPTHLLAAHSNPTPECTCTLQIRMPSGPIKGHFRPSDTLRTVHQYVGLHLEPPADFNLVTTFPKRVFSGDQLDTTLQQADLVPRAVLICELI